MISTPCLLRQPLRRAGGTGLSRGRHARDARQGTPGRGPRGPAGSAPQGWARGAAPLSPAGWSRSGGTLGGPLAPGSSARCGAQEAAGRPPAWGTQHRVPRFPEPPLPLAAKASAPRPSPSAAIPQAAAFRHRAVPRPCQRPAEADGQRGRWGATMAPRAVLNTAGFALHPASGTAPTSCLVY